jgi:hypothetical protein
MGLLGQGAHFPIAGHRSTPMAETGPSLRRAPMSAMRSSVLCKVTRIPFTHALKAAAQLPRSGHWRRSAAFYRLEVNSVDKAALMSDVCEADFRYKMTAAD